MVSTRGSKSSDVAEVGEKRPAASTKPGSESNKKAKKEDGKLEVGEDGQVGLKEGTSDVKNDTTDDRSQSSSQKASLKKGGGKDEVDDSTGSKAKDKSKAGEDMDKTRDEMKAEEGEKAEKGEDEVDEKTLEGTKEELDEPKHGTLESGHIYFLYRPKIDHGDDVASIDDISKFHMVLIPKSPPHDKNHFHRIIEVGKKKMPDPGAKHQVIWGLVSAVGSDKAAFKDTFGAYSYETKTRGTRHQEAARPAARGHYILHSPRDPLADDPSKNRQRDFKLILAYEITTPTSDDFGQVQEELGLAPKDAVALQVKDPEVQNNNNPRAAAIPREKRAQYPEHLSSLFRGRRFIPANPPSFISYSGAELLIVSSPHTLEESLGKDGEKVEHDLDEDAKAEKEGVEGAIAELGLSKGEFEIEALEGEWA